MKNATLTVSFESEKLDALTYHMGKKEADLQAELNDTMQKLYEKHVPQATREYIEDRLTRESAVKDKTKRPVRPAPRPTSEPQA
ncbi:MAG: DUF6103 family protein [Hydrogenoanaerobacterium sp.]